MASSPTILYIDNEINNLISFGALFRREYKIIPASSVTEALTVLKNGLVEIIICSKNLNGMSGIEFLRLTISMYPNSTRLLVSDYINLDTENKAQIFNYLIKPWDEVKIRQILKEAHALFEIKEIISKNSW
ncbi:Response regulator receiver domain-containing protein [Dyadobacter koreensis]|uniref:Response regulator receiver domain-containing protein n=1 Tax=Dyadobacter koreensis TaxID=408657 RepID=A0A1H6Q947_9BACT|nr:response regulator [Dyadobacter koreensis]SEI38366.1 Response regulator receiver domain-containing protein [Dyadobacter koreensis]